MLESADRAATIAAALHLAAVQDPDIQDAVGFSNSDVGYGRQLVRFLEANLDDESSERALAYLIGVKYRRQAIEIVGAEALERVATYGSERSYVIADRERMRSTVFVQRLADGRFALDHQNTSAFAFDRADLELHRDRTKEDTVRYIGDADSVRTYLERVSGAAGIVIGDQPNESDVAYARAHAADAKRIRVLVRPESTDQQAVLAFERYDPALVDALKSSVPSFGRRFAEKAWWIEARHVPSLAAALDAAGANVTAVRDRYGDMPAETITVAPLRTALPFEEVGDRVYVGPLAYEKSQAMAAAAKALPQRGYLAQEKRWHFPSVHLPQFIDNLDQARSDLDYEALRTRAAEIHDRLYRKESVRIPEEHLGLLRDYQHEGVKFLTTPMDELRRMLGPSVKGQVLGDKMGLGKTLQAAIAAHAVAAGEHIVIVAPANALYVWEREIHKKMGREQRVNVVAEGRPIDPSAQWHVLSYNTVPAHYERLKAMGFAVLIADEAQYCKNYQAIRSVYVNTGFLKVIDPATKKPKLDPVTGRAVQVKIDGLSNLATKRVYALTGTPFPNRLRDSYALWQMVGHPVARTFKSFAERYCDPVFNGFAWDYNGATNVEDLRQVVSPLFIQRFTEDVAKDIPPLTKRVVPIEIDRGVLGRVIEEHRHRNAGGLNGAGALAYATAHKFATAHAKAPSTADHIRDAIEAGEKVIVFSEYTTVLDVFSAAFPQGAVRIDGSLSPAAKARAVDRFQEDGDVRLLIGQMVSAGTAITLTAAHREVFNDFSWNPDTMQQALMRAVRIGLDHPVTADFMAAAGTMDEKLADTLEDKLDVVSRFEGRNQSFFNVMIPDIERDLGQPLRSAHTQQQSAAAGFRVA